MICFIANIHIYSSHLNFNVIYDVHIMQMHDCLFTLVLFVYLLLRGPQGRLATSQLGYSLKIKYLLTYLLTYLLFTREIRPFFSENGSSNFLPVFFLGRGRERENLCVYILGYIAIKVKAEMQLFV